MRAVEDPRSDITSMDALARRAPFVLLPLIASLAVALRFANLGSNSFWADEFWSLFAAKMSLSSMIDWTAGDVHPPLYYAVLHGWVELAGTSETSLRAPSAFFGASAVVILMLATWRVGPLVACGAGALLALNGAHIAFSQEARMYPLIGCLALVCCIALGRFIASPGYREAALYAVALTALLYTDYVGFLLGGIQAAIIAVYAVQGRTGGRGLAIGLRGALALVIVGAAFGPWWSTFFAQLDHVSLQHVPAPTWHIVSKTLSAEVGLQLMGYAWLVVAIPVLLLAIVAFRTRVRDPILISVSALALVPALQILASFGRQPIFDQKRALPFAGGFAFLFALGVAEGIHLVRNDRWGMRRYAGSAAIALATLTSGVFLLQGANRALGARALEDWRTPGAEVESAGLPVYMWREYLDIKLGVYAPSADLRAISPGTMDIAQDGFGPIPRGSAGSEVMLLIGDISGARQPAVNGALDALKPYFETVSHKHYLGGIDTYRLRTYSASEYNVAIFGLPASQRWGVDPDGYLMTTADESPFRSRASLDFNQDGVVDVDAILHIEYRLDGGTSGTLSSRYSTDGSAPLSPTALLPPAGGEWKAVDVPIAAGGPVPVDFALSGGLHVRALEIRRYATDGGDVLRRETDIARQWFLRPDGYLEPAIAGACVRLNVADATEAQITYEYLQQFAWHTAAATSIVSGQIACISGLSPGTIVRHVQINPG